MPVSTLLIANRGEIALRIIRAAAEAGLTSVAVYAQDEGDALHRHRADRAVALPGTGPAGYLDIEAVVGAAKEAGADAVHPGYGFLAENAAFARACAAAGITFVGPSPDTLDAFGDKVAARALAAQCDVPVLRGTPGTVDAAGAAAFLASLGAGRGVMLKARSGGGGRGMRAVTDAAELAEAFARCSSEAQAAFGDGAVYAEELIATARHIEVQVVGDGTSVIALGERECSLQRRHQKLIELAPSPWISEELRAALCDAACRMAAASGYRGLGTFEFLVDASDPTAAMPTFAFIEANPRIQVEHTVTEEVMGVDLVLAQLRIAAGATLDEVGLGADRLHTSRGHAVQVRVNMETMTADGGAKPAGGTLSVFETPSGPGVRVDTFGYAGYRTSPRYDSLLAKVITHSPSSAFVDAVARARRALRELRIGGVATNAGFLDEVLAHPDFVAGRVHTRWLDAEAAALVAASEGSRVGIADVPTGAAPAPGGTTAGGAARAGVRLDSSDPLAVLAHGQTRRATETASGAGSSDAALAEGVVAVPAPMQGTLVAVDVAVGDTVRAGQQVAVMEAMKMEHVLTATVGGVVRSVAVAPGDTVFEGETLLTVEESDAVGAVEQQTVAVDLDRIRPDLAEVHHRRHLTLDEARPDAVAKRRKTGQRTARENIADLCDDGSFVEYGSYAIAAQRRRRAVQDLIEKTPADGMVTGVGRVNGDLFPDDRAQTVVLSYDYTVLAGTQGTLNHRKKDRMFELAAKERRPLIIFTEGGGGRPGDTDAPGVAGLDCLAFTLFGQLSGLVPMVGINSGRCFAGNAALLGCCDVVIATKNSSIGMGGPAMIEGGGLGVFHPDDVGPMSVQTTNGVVDIEVEDEEEAVAVAKKYLSYFQGAVSEWECADQRILRNVIPENRLRVYDVREVIENMADTDSVLELRKHFGVGMITSFIRIEGRPMGVIANNPMHLAGAIDSDGADKAARFLQLCDAFDIPVLFLCDTPGMMVGPEIEATALVRHCSRLFVIGGSVTIPFMTIVLRKGYGLGAQAMAGGSFKAPVFTVAWPTGEFGGMGLEGAVKLGYRNELAAIEDPAERKATFDTMVARMYEHGKALNMASHFEIDEVIDPVDSRARIVSALRTAPTPPPRTGKKRPCVDTW